MRAALYARVSTHDQQTLDLEVEAMTAHINGRGWEAVRQAKDVSSGAKERPGREGLLKAARRREIGSPSGVGYPSFCGRRHVLQSRKTLVSFREPTRSPRLRIDEIRRYPGSHRPPRAVLGTLAGAEGVVQRDAQVGARVDHRLIPAPGRRHAVLLARDRVDLRHDHEALAGVRKRLVDARAAAVDDHEVGSVPRHEPLQDVDRQDVAGPETIAGDDDSHDRTTIVMLK